MPEQRIEPFEPGLPVMIAKGETGSHLVDICGRMVIVGIDKTRAELKREGLSDAALAASRYSHDQYDERPMR